MKQGQGIPRRIITLVLTIAMLFGLACTPIGRVQASAAEAPMDDAPTTIAAASGPVVTPNDHGSYDVTFTYHGNASSVSLRGDLPGINWDPGKVMIQDPEGVWTTTVTDVDLGNYKYKFFTNDWTFDPDTPYKPYDNNSFLPVGYQSAVVNGTSVTISYYDPSADPGTVKVAGSMTNWATDAVLMTDDGKGLFTCTIDDLAPGDYQYQIIIVTGSDSQAWHQDPANTAALTGESIQD